MEFTTAIYNYDILSKLKAGQKLIVINDKLEIDQRIGQFIRRSITGDSKKDILKPLHDTFDLVIDVFDKDEIHKLYKNIDKIETILLQTYPDWSDLQKCIANLKGKIIFNADTQTINKIVSDHAITSETTNLTGVELTTIDTTGMTPSEMVNAFIGYDVSPNYANNVITTLNNNVKGDDMKGDDVKGDDVKGNNVKGDDNNVLNRVVPNEMVSNEIDSAKDNTHPTDEELIQMCIDNSTERVMCDDCEDDYNNYMKDLYIKSLEDESERLDDLEDKTVLMEIDMNYISRENEELSKKMDLILLEIQELKNRQNLSDDCANSNIDELESLILSEVKNINNRHSLDIESIEMEIDKTNQKHRIDIAQMKTLQKLYYDKSKKYTNSIKVEIEQEIDILDEDVEQMYAYVEKLNAKK